MAEYCNGFIMLDPNEDKFIMQQGSDDFRSWSGLRGPCYTPHIDIETGTLWFSNDAGLPNPDPVRIVGQDGRGIQLAGYASSVEDLPDDAAYGDCWAVGEEDPLEAYAWFDGWCDLGELFPRGQDGTDGVSPEVTITSITGGNRVKITDKDHPAGQTFDVMNGQNGRDGTDGENGEDGVSPEVTMTEITGGTRLTITDAEHPSGQSSDIMNGTAGPGVPAGGSAGQYLKKASGTDYDTTWDTLGADDVGYDGTQSYTAGTAGKKIKDLDAELTLAENSVTPYVVGNTNTTGVKLDPGVFVWVKNHSTLSDGLYTVKTTAIVSGGSVVDTNMNAVSVGGLNDLRNTLNTLVSAITPGSGTIQGTSSVDASNCSVFKSAGLISILGSFSVSADISGNGGVLGTLPTGFRPTDTIVVPTWYTNYNGSAVCDAVRIYTNGTITTYIGSYNVKANSKVFFTCTFA